MNQKQIVGFLVIGAAIFLGIKLLPMLLALTFGLLGMVINLAVWALIIYVLYRVATWAFSSSKSN
ncbi:MAG: hypothetical protein AAFU60_09810 [Bacteroidota bacterium]